LEANAYLDYYGLDLSQEFPAARFSLGAVSSGGYRLALHCWQQPEAHTTLLLVHGYFDHVGLYGHLVRFGLDQGANVVAFDLPGHGLSSGPPGEIRDFSEYRQAIVDSLSAVEYLPGPRRVIAQSTGAAAVMDYLQSGQTPSLDRVVLLAPLVRPAQWRRIVFTHSLLHRFIENVPRDFAESSQDRDFLDFLRNDPLQSLVVPVCWVTALRRWIPRFLAGEPCDKPILVVQGGADDTVDWRYNIEQIKRLFPAMDLFQVAPARHQLANEREDLRAAYLEKVGDYLSLPRRRKTAWS
jgi:alpha-beta hydrolase superfamily lysophospholipase